MWVTWAGVLALFDTVRELLPGARRRARQFAPDQPIVPRAPRLPSLTPTG
jgi:hypothetical protein